MSYDREMGAFQAHFENIFHQLDRMAARLTEVEKLNTEVGAIRKQTNYLHAELTALRSEIREGFKKGNGSRWRDYGVVASGSSVTTGAVIMVVIKLLEML